MTRNAVSGTGDRRHARKPSPPPSPSSVPGVWGAARVDRHAGRLLRRLQPGDVAVLDQPDLDRPTAAALLSHGVSAVVNASPCISGRYPTYGAAELLAAGIPVLDCVGLQVLARLTDGEQVRVHDDGIWCEGRLVGRGRVLAADLVAAETTQAGAGLAVQLEAFAGAAVQLARNEGNLLLEGVGLPVLATSMLGRSVLVVTPNGRDDLRAVRRWVRAARPVLVGVAAGTGVLLDAGMSPDVVVADLEALDDREYACGAELVAVRGPHEPPDQRTGTRPQRSSSLLITLLSAEDVAVLLAEAGQADVVVLAGGRARLSGLLETGGAPMAGTVLCRTKAGDRLVHARALPAVVPRGPGWPWVIVLLTIAVAALIGAGLMVTGVLPSGWVVR
ncbi:MAG: putative cytokinetic ring protein SteA [Actinomycetes bacterium]